MKRAYKDVLIFGTISFEGTFSKANSKLSQISHYLKDSFNEFVLWNYTHHSKTLKDGWAKYIQNFALKWC